MAMAGVERQRWEQGKRQRMAKGHARGCVCQKGSGGNGGVVETLVAGSLGVVAEAAEAWHGKVHF